MAMMLTDSKTGIMYRKWDSVSPKAVFLMVHGLGAQSERWNFLADFLAKNGLASYAIELRGYGETKELRAHIDSFNVYYNDLTALCEIIKTELPGKKIFIIGESMGGLIAYLATVKFPGFFSGLVCISPVFVNVMPFAWYTYVQFIVSLIFNQRATLKMPFNSAWITRDVEYQKRLDADTRELRIASVKTLWEILMSQIACGNAKDKLKTPVLFLLAEKDKLTSPMESKKVFDALTIKDKTVFTYPEMYHALSIDIGKEKVFADILEWCKGRC
ncbi:MAG: lysophospholipase [Elusimicrobiota bacterium]